ncbi:MAG: Lrp/AsnC ligand binding domain-containing protein [Ferruginibacter sp.]|nr:Lrp/AsnC ligand binding domain-containing protein [Ferruginibacter sp.]
MASKTNLDNLDFQIINEMMENAGTSYAELGKRLSVSGGTIHVRMKKLQEEKIIKGTKIKVDLGRLGYNVSAFIGVFLEKCSQHDDVVAQLKEIPEVVRLNFTTGAYSMLLEVVCKDIVHLRNVLRGKVQKIEGIGRTETYISLEEGFSRKALISAS